MKTIFAIFLSLIFLNTQNASSAELQELRFTNRARCALDSQKPTERAFLLINNMDVARSLYRLAKNRGEDSTQLTEYGIRVYRQSIIKLFQLIHHKLINGELPLLNADASKSQSSHYRNLMQKCRSDESCMELNDYLKQIWSGKKDIELSFFNQRSFSSNNRIPKLQCAYLKKFSPLEAQLFATKPTLEILQEIGLAAINKNDYIADCDDDKAQVNVKVASFEFSLPIEHHHAWNAQGFNYWNSMKIYFSWAYRHSPEMHQLSYPFSAIFKSVEIEDSVMLTPSGCKSITIPKCEASYLNQNALREFAKNDFLTKAPTLDILRPLPEGPTAELLTSAFGEVNRDILNLGQNTPSDDWLDHFRDNFSKSRSLIRKKLLSALTTLNIITTQISNSRVIELIQRSVGQLKNNDDKNALYYLCAEFSFTGDKQLSFIKNNLELLKQTTLLDEINAKIIKQSSQTLFNRFEQLSSEVNLLCQNLHQKQIWNDRFNLDISGFNSWYLNRAYEKNISSTNQEKRIALLKSHPPLLAYSSFYKSTAIQDVICVDAIDCARTMLASIIDLYSATTYADTFWNLDRMIKSPDLFNPYAERTACQIYDPWFKTKSTLFSFMTNVAQAGLSLSYPGVIYAKFDLLPRQTMSFNQLVKDGKIFYHQRFDKKRINAGLAMDFGKLLNIPCSISIAHSDLNNPLHFHQFQGISVRACKSNEKNSIEINEQNQSSAHRDRISRCLVCSMNFESVASYTSKTYSGINSSFFLARAFYNLFKGLTDPNNIPHSWSVQPEQVKKVLLEHHGEIPRECVYPLSHSRECIL